MFFFGILWTCGNGSKNWDVGWHDFGRQAIQVDVAGGRTANKPEKCGMGLTSVEEPTVSEGSQIPTVTHAAHPVRDYIDNAKTALPNPLYER